MLLRGGGLGETLELFHARVKLRTHLRALEQLAVDVIELRQILLVADLVLKACPPVHGDGAELHLDAHHALLIVQEDGRFHDEVQAAVAVGLGRGNVVLALEERNVVLLQKGIGELVDIRREGADDAHADDVVEIFLDALHRQREAAALELFGDALGGLEARVASGQVDVLVTYADARRDYAERWNTEFNREASIWEETNVIGVTAPIYNDTISVSKNSEIMDDALIAALQNAFINIGNTDEGKQVIAIYSHNGYQKAQSSDYDNERAAQKLIQELTAAN